MTAILSREDRFSSRGDPSDRYIAMIRDISSLNG